MLPNTKTKQEIDVKTLAIRRTESIPDYVFHEILEERKKYEKNRSRWQHGFAVPVMEDQGVFPTYMSLIKS